MLGFAKKLFGSSNDRRVKALAGRVAQINALEPAFAALSDAELKGKTAEFKQRIAAGESLDKIQPEPSPPCARPPSAPSACVTSTCRWSAA